MEREAKITLPPSKIRRRGWEQDLNTLRSLSNLGRESDYLYDRLPVSFETDYPYVFLMFLSDVHLGHIGTDYDAIETYVKTIQNYPIYVITLGDLGDFFSPKILPNAMMEDVVNPTQQMEAIQSFFGAIKEKTLAVQSGNHEAFSRSASGVEAYRWMTEDLGIPILKAQAVVDLGANDVNYKLLVAHRFARINSQYNRSHAGKMAIRLHDEEIDLVASGDKHLGTAEQTYVGERPITVIQTGTFKVDDNWGREVGFAEPPNIFFPLVAFDTRVKKRPLPIGDLDHAVEFIEAVDDIWKRTKAKEKRQALKDVKPQT